MSEENYTLEEITPDKGRKLLKLNDGHPVKGPFRFWNSTVDGYVEGALDAILVGTAPFKFYTNGDLYAHCARIIYGYGYLPDGTKVTDRYPLPEGYELCPWDEQIGEDFKLLEVACDKHWRAPSTTHSPTLTPLGFHGARRIQFAIARRVSPVAARHNPDGLTEAQVETDMGWRLLSEEENHHLPAAGNCFEIEMWSAKGVWNSECGWGGGELQRTYRTRQPEGYFLPKNGRVAKAGEVWCVKDTEVIDDCNVIVGDPENPKCVNNYTLHYGLDYKNCIAHPKDREISESNGDTFLAESVEAYYRKKHGEEVENLFLHASCWKQLKTVFPDFEPAGLRKEGE